jgi:hypothetical protein
MDSGGVLSLPFLEGMEVIFEGLKKSIEDRDFMLYVAVYPYMDSKSFVDFDKFRKMLRGGEENPDPNRLIESAERIKALDV